MENKLTPDLLLSAYANGYFPMAESRDAKELLWFHPEKRGVIPLDTFHLPRKLERQLRKNPFTVTTDKAFRAVMEGCAAREETWINDSILELYCALHAQGFAHSVECREKEKLVGGLYGVSIGGAFFGESMFSRVENASKAALAHLVPLLKNAGYRLLDTQYVNDHLKQFGVVEIPRGEYMELLKTALQIQPEYCWK